MDNESARELIKGKKIAVIGSQKSAIDIAAECAAANGKKLLLIKSFIFRSVSDT